MYAYNLAKYTGLQINIIEPLSPLISRVIYFQWICNYVIQGNTIHNRVQGWIVLRTRWAIFIPTIIFSNIKDHTTFFIFRVGLKK